MYLDLVNIFESFLPQLLRYPNPADPLNGEAAALHQESIEKYNLKVRDYVTRYASNGSSSSASASPSSPDEDRKISSESTSATTITTTGNSDIDETKYDQEDEDDDVDDGASDMSDL